MSRRAVYDGLRIKSSQQPQMRGFLEQSSRRTYEAEIRRLLQEHGYPEMHVRLRDEQAVKAVQTHSQRVATSIQRTYNRLLRNAVNALPRSVDGDAAAKSALERGFLRRAIDYNNRTLNPWVGQRIREMAQRHFYQRNGITTRWKIVGPTPADTDVCQRDMDKGVVDDPSAFEAVDGYPAHPNCQHRTQAVKPDPQSLPPADQVWYGA